MQFRLIDSLTVVSYTMPKLNMALYCAADRPPLIGSIVSGLMSCAADVYLALTFLLTFWLVLPSPRALQRGLLHGLVESSDDERVEFWWRRPNQSDKLFCQRQTSSHK